MVRAITVAALGGVLHRAAKGRRHSRRFAGYPPRVMRRWRPVTWPGFIATQIGAVLVWGLSWRQASNSWSQAMVVALVTGLGSVINGFRFSGRRSSRHAPSRPTRYIDL